MRISCKVILGLFLYMVNALLLFDIRRGSRSYLRIDFERFWLVSYILFCFICGFCIVS